MGYGRAALHGVSGGRHAGGGRVSRLRRSLSSDFTVVFSSSCCLMSFPMLGTRSTVPSRETISLNILRNDMPIRREKGFAEEVPFLAVDVLFRILG